MTDTPDQDKPAEPTATQLATNNSGYPGTLAAEREQAPKTPQRRLSLEAWSTILTFLWLASTIAFSVAALVQNERLANVEASRVETGWVSSNNYSKGTIDGGGLKPSYNPKFGGGTQFIGVKRKIPFKSGFSQKPEVVAALQLINNRSAYDVLDKIGALKDVVGEDAEIAARLRRPNIIVFTSEKYEDSFDLHVGMAIPVAAAQKIVAELESKDSKWIDQLVLDELKNSDLRQDATLDNLTPDEKWCIRFHKLIGTLDAVWIAQAKSG